jgi:hypothetical protein
MRRGPGGRRDLSAGCAHLLPPLPPEPEPESEELPEPLELDPLDEDPLDEDPLDELEDPPFFSLPDPSSSPLLAAAQNLLDACGNNEAPRGRAQRPQTVRALQPPATQVRGCVTYHRGWRWLVLALAA